MKQAHILKAILRMAEDNNQGLSMTTTVLDTGTVDDVSSVTFRVEKKIYNICELTGTFNFRR